MDESSRNAWRNDIRQRAGGVAAEDVLQPAGSPAPAPDPSSPDPNSAQASPGSSALQSERQDDHVRELLAKYKDVSIQAADGRYRMYRDLAELITEGVFKSIRAVQECPRLACLHINRHKLATVLDLRRLGGGVPEDVPPKFRVGLRAALCQSPDFR